MILLFLMLLLKLRNLLKGLIFGLFKAFYLFPTDVNSVWQLVMYLNFEINSKVLRTSKTLLMVSRQDNSFWFLFFARVSIL